MEKAGNSWQPPRLARGEEGFFPDPRIHHAIEAERQRAQGEIVASMRRPPAPFSSRLSTEARHSFPVHGLAPDQPSPLLPSRPHTLFLSVRGPWMECLHFLLLFLVLSWRALRANCLHPWFPFRRSSGRICLHFLFLSQKGTLSACCASAAQPQISTASPKVPAVFAPRL
ncbi:hypothetical protein AMECASPLE_018702 [Ameca splendens]|uniref:Uncharacterized protein n=1 Tax=Ameca splendens TaxID=208324 RepID=A0ABV0YPQ8_9TELE